MPYTRIISRASRVRPVDACPATFTSSYGVWLADRVDHIIAAASYNRTPIMVAVPHASGSVECHATQVRAVTRSSAAMYGYAAITRFYTDTSIAAPDATVLLARTWLRAMPTHLYTLTVYRSVSDAAFEVTWRRLNNPLWWPFMHLDATEADVAAHKADVAKLLAMYPVERSPRAPVAAAHVARLG